MREDVVSDFFYRVIEIYCAAERDLLRDAFECTKGRPPQSDSELDDWLDTDEGKLATMFAPASASMSGRTTCWLCGLHDTSHRRDDETCLCLALSFIFA